MTDDVNTLHTILQMFWLTDVLITVGFLAVIVAISCKRKL